jgi:Protein of unknown function (DUF1236)
MPHDDHPQALCESRCCDRSGANRHRGGRNGSGDDAFRNRGGSSSRNSASSRDRGVGRSARPRGDFCSSGVFDMHRTGIAVSAAALLTIAASVAQAATLPLAPSDASKLKGWIDTQTVTAAPLPDGFMVEDGAVVPKSITLDQIPASAGVASATKYDYAKIGDRTVLVDPTDRMIVYLIS